MSFQQKQFLHSSVMPRLTMFNNGQQRPSRPLSDATSIASSTDFEDEIYLMAQNKASRAPVYKYSQYADNNLPEEDIEDESPTIEGESIDALFSKAQRMNTWLSVSDGRNSVGSDAKTMSSYDEAITPKTPPTEFTPRSAATKSMTLGPRGPHLFRTFSSGSASDLVYEEEYATPISPIHPSALPFGRSPQGTPVVSAPESDVSDLEEDLDEEEDNSLHYNVSKPDIRLDVNYRPMSAISIALENVQDAEVENWSTLKVCEWMRGLGFETSLIEKFRKNDITGAILMTLQWEDLKDLDISSFGKRVELWSEMNHLRKSPQIPSPSSSRSSPTYESVESPTRGLHSPPILSRHASRKSRESNWSKRSSNRSSKTVRQSDGPFLTTPKFASIHENEHEMPITPPRTHSIPNEAYFPDVPEVQVQQESSEEYISASDVEDDYDEDALHQPQLAPIMPSLQSRRGRAVPALALQRSRESMSDARKSTGSTGKAVFTAPNPSKRRVRISPGLMSPLSPSPRVIDICFEQAINPAPRRVSMLVPASPRWGANPSFPPAPSICASSDVLGYSEKPSVALKSDDLRKVSMLTAQEQVNKFLTLQHLQNLENRVHSPPPATKLQSQVTSPTHLVSPREVPLPPTPHDASVEALHPPSFQRSMSMRTPNNKKLTKGDRTLTTIIPSNHMPGYTEIENHSDVLPPMPRHNAHKGNTRANTQSPSLPSQGTKVVPRSTIMAPTNAALNVKTQFAPAAEDPEWEDTSSGHDSVPSSPSERVYSGELKKRTNNWLRHEWTTHHAELQGTRLTIYKSSSSPEAMTTVEMDDYTVACTSNSSNKFGRSLKNSSKKDSEGSYTFQLMPLKKQGEPKKEHHFAVSTREERIDWMRELMLCKAMKQKKLGFQVEVNGKMI